MWGLEFVADRISRQPFPPSMHLANRLFEQAFERGLIVYVMSGCADGVAGDHLMVSPPLVVTEGQIDEIVEILIAVVTPPLPARTAELCLSVQKTYSIATNFSPKLQNCLTKPLPLEKAHVILSPCCEMK